VQRIAVHGASGSGKSTLARILADRLSSPRTELDALFHQPGWTELPTDEFRDRVTGLVAGERWVIEGNYRQVRDLVWARADLIVVLDPPRWTVMRQLLGRTVRRGLRREELWNGNRESLANLLSADAGRNVMLWSWRTLDRYHVEVRDEARRLAPHAQVVVMRTRCDIDRLVDAAADGPRTPWS
jgi:adenylate kinase family enzyme